jgi:NarL family two-component system response regulator LiaR
MTREAEANMEAIRVFVVDDHPMIRHGLAAMLAPERGVAWVGEAGSGAEAVRCAPALAPDVMLVDLEMPGMDGLAVIAALRPLLPRARFVMLLAAPDADAVRRAIAGGAAGVLAKDASTPELVNVIHAAHFGYRLLAPAVTDAVAARHLPCAPGADLTRRERELLALMARGLPNQEISARLAIAIPTVKFHVTNILSKLHAENRTGAVLAALRHNLVGLE